MTVVKLWKVFFDRRERGADDELRDQLWTAATGLTLGRAAISSAILVAAIVEESRELLLVGLGLSMILDIADGLAARRMERETVFGAQLDALADRLAVALAIIATLGIDGGAGTAIAAAAVAIQFCGIDLYLTFQFLRFGLWSPDHYYVINERVWRANWSAASKFASNVPIGLLAIGLWPAALALSTLLFVLRLPSAARVQHDARKLPEPNLCLRPHPSHEPKLPELELAEPPARPPSQPQPAHAAAAARPRAAVR